MSNETQSEEVKPPQEIYVPARARTGYRRRVKVAMNIIGRAGCGKSHCAVQQFVNDPGYGPSEVLVAMAEDSTASYGTDEQISKIAIEPVNSFAEVSALVNDLARAAKAGKRLPKLFVLDDLSILSQKERQHYDKNPILSEGSGNRDTRTEFRLKGYNLVDALMDIRTVLPIDSFTLIRAHEGTYNSAPEIALEGNIAPKNLTGMSSITLYMKGEAPKYSVEQFLAAAKAGQLFTPYRTVGMSKEEVDRALEAIAKGQEVNVDTTVINRYFMTQNTGEIEAKGHHALRLKEKAYLPGILRRIHGEKPLTTWG